MNKIFVIISCCILLLSCGQQKNNTTDSPLTTLEDQAINQLISHPEYPLDFEGIYQTLIRSNDNCKYDFYTFYLRDLEFQEYDFEVQYYDLVQKEDDCLLWYYHAVEERYYWEVINLTKEDKIEFETSCLPDYDSENGIFTYCDEEAIQKTHLEYQSYMSSFD